MRKPLFVRCTDYSVFEVSRRTLEPKTSSIYDPYCFCDPREDVEYIEYTDWCTRKWNMYFENVKGKYSA